MADRLYLSIAREFSETPGPRYRKEGKFSGDEFLEDHLLRKFEEAIRLGCKLHVDLDGTEGYATSFLEASFGGLARRFNVQQVQDTLEFTSNDEPYLLKEIEKYIREAIAK